MTNLKSNLRSIGIDPDLEFRRQHPGARRTDGWSALGVYQQGVTDRQRLFEELGSMGLIPEDLHSKTLLDFGCGLAPSAIAMAPRMQLTVGLDASFAHCVSAVECVEHLQLSNVAVLHGSLLPFPEFPTVPFRAAGFDMVISHHGFWRKDFARLLPDLSGLLKEHGYLYLVYPRFWFSTSGLNEDEVALRAYMEERVSNWSWVSLQSIEQLAEMCGLELAYHGSLHSLPAEQTTGIIFVSSGIVNDRAGFTELIGDFSRRWLISQEIMVLKRR